jgi:hypothetical protein
MIGEKPPVTVEIVNLGLENPVKHMVRLLDRESIAICHGLVEPAGAHPEREYFAAKVMSTLQKHGLMIGPDDRGWRSIICAIEEVNSWTTTVDFDTRVAETRAERQFGKVLDQELVKSALIHAGDRVADIRTRLTMVLRIAMPPGGTSTNPTNKFVEVEPSLPASRNMLTDRR